MEGLGGFLLCRVRRGGEGVTPGDDAGLQDLAGRLEAVRPFLQLAPEIDVRIIAVERHVLGRHVERVGLQLERWLAAFQGVTRDGVDLADDLVSHGEAAHRRAGAMDHDGRSGRAVRLVVGVGKPGVEGQVIVRVRIHLPGANGVDAFRRLSIAALVLRPELARPSADRIGLDVDKAPVAVLLPDLDLRLFLVAAQDERRRRRRVLRRHDRERGGRGSAPAPSPARRGPGPVPSA